MSRDSRRITMFVHKEGVVHTHSHAWCGNATTIQWRNGGSVQGVRHLSIAPLTPSLGLGSQLTRTTFAYLRRRRMLIIDCRIDRIGMQPWWWPSNPERSIWTHGLHCGGGGDRHRIAIVDHHCHRHLLVKHCIDLRIRMATIAW